MNKLESLHIKNFQIHNDSELLFHPGVNIIAGSSRNGKSSLLRGLRLALENKPSGFEYTPHNAPKSTLTESIVKFSDAQIHRSRSDTINTYKLIKDGKESTYKKFGQSVPDEIQEALGLKNYNLQTQHDQYFLLQDSGSAVAEELNKVSGLQIIDETLDNVNSIVNSSKSEIKLSEKVIQDQQNRLTELEFVDSVALKIKDIDSWIEECSKLDKEKEELQKCIQNMISLQEELEQINKFLKIIPIYNSLKNDINQSQKDKKELQELSELINNIQKMEEESQKYLKIISLKNIVCVLSSDIVQYGTLSEQSKELNELIQQVQKLSELQDDVKEWLKVKGKYEALNDMILEFKKMDHYSSELDILCSQITNMQKKHKSLENIIKEKREEKELFIKDIGICPLCGRG